MNPSPSGPVLAAEINALPERLRRYVHDLEQRADPAGDVRRAFVAEGGGMTFDEFMNYVRRLANQCWVRYYLHQIPGRMVLELAMAEVRRPEELNRELVAAGFSPVSGLHTFGALHCWRWSVERVERAEGGRR